MRMELALVLALGALAPLAARAAGDCRLERTASLDMTSIANGVVTVPVQIGGRPVDMLVDTGGISSLLTESTVDALGLERLPVPAAQNTVLYGGKRLDHFVIAKDIALGTLSAAKKRFVVAPDSRLPTGAGGTVASDMLASLDVEFDFANARLNLYSQDHCRGRVVTWTRDAIAAIPVRVSKYNQITLEVRIDGMELDATLDTGTSRSVLSLETAEAMFGLSETSPGMQLLGVAGAYRYPFKSLAFGGVTAANPDVVLVSDKYSPRVAGVPPLILGMETLRRLHFFIAYSEGRLYVSPAGAH
jgi:predicted aspartyl protease